jgi:outer membrane immunogenic protein
MAVKAPIIVPFSWAGAYVGGNVGYGWASDPVSLTDTTVTTSRISHDADVPDATFVTGPTTITSGSASGGVNPNGVIGGVQGGYNWQSGMFVYGLEADFQGSGQNGSATIGSGIATAGYKLPWFGTFRGRIGFTPDPRWLVYATGGLAVAQIDESVSEGPAPGLAISGNSVRAGFAVGGGVETAVTEHWSIKAEYLFMGFGTLGLNGTGAPVVTDTFAGPRIETITTATTTANLSARITDNVVRVGANYRF